MLLGRPGVLGLLVVLGATAGCSAEAEQPSRLAADVAVAAYEPAAGAPHFCALLAASTHLTGLPGAVGSMAAESRTVEAQLDLSAGIAELRAVLDDVRSETGYTDVETVLQDLVVSLTSAIQGPLTDVVRVAISDGLDAVGRRVQPVCTFPT